jgi:hypothetical protein
MFTVNDHVRYESHSRVKIGRVLLCLAFCALLSFLHHDAAAEERGRSQNVVSADIDYSVVPTLGHDPVYRIPLRVHLGESGRSPADFVAVLEEINDIWLPQAGICFEMQIVKGDEPMEKGMDIWFLPVLPGDPGLNGIFRDEHHIQVRDTPILGPASHPAHYSAARTAAHECGHGLSLLHRQDSDDNLMRSKTYGWQLNAREVQVARGAAAEKALQDTAPRNCSYPRIESPQEPSTIISDFGKPFAN